MRDVRFGISLVPEWAKQDELLVLTRVADEAGLDLIGIQDHPYQWRFLDTWTLIAFLAARTSRIRFFPDVASLPLRPPAVLAKAAASLDVLSGGRVELGLGAGAFWDAIEAMGGSRRSPGEAVAAIEEAIEVIRLVWSGQRNLRFQGAHYHLAGAQSGPPPAHPIGIWLGVYGPRALRLAGRVADGWVPSFRGELRPLLDMAARLDDAAAAAGRDPAALRRVLNVAGEVTDGTSQGTLHGPVGQWTDELTALAVGAGFDTFVLSAEGPGQLARFATEVAPAVRARVAEERRPT
jgi:alkanesulfonate monooxygenase SsuD/methylene tetrahydromethanopterin reductase-like flavin-dependent oxidoreductase (luciferase family)